MSVRHRGRELAFQILFQCDQTGDKVNAVVARFQELGRAHADAAHEAHQFVVAIDRLRERVAQRIGGILRARRREGGGVHAASCGRLAAA